MSNPLEKTTTVSGFLTLHPHGDMVIVADHRAVTITKTLGDFMPGGIKFCERGEFEITVKYTPYDKPKPRENGKDKNHGEQAPAA